MKFEIIFCIPTSITRMVLILFHYVFISGTSYEHPLKVTIIKGHFNWIAVAFQHFVGLYRCLLSSLLLCYIMLC